MHYAIIYVIHTLSYDAVSGTSLGCLQWSITFCIWFSPSLPSRGFLLHHVPAGTVDDDDSQSIALDDTTTMTVLTVPLPDTDIHFVLVVFTHATTNLVSFCLLDRIKATKFKDP